MLADRYEVRERVGAGGVAEVYLAHDRTRQTNVAVKILAGDACGGVREQERFVAEARLASSLSHPNIIRVHDVGVHRGRPFITMELLHGRTLRSFLDQRQQKRAPLAIEEALAMGDTLLAALAHAHQQLVHRDLKPENIWIGDDGTLKIMDFGLARSLQERHATRPMASIASAYYVAPELLRGATGDHRVDQYAAAAVIYEMLAGHVPAGVVKPLHALRRDVPRAVSQALMRALSQAPEERFANIDKLRDALRAARVDVLDWRAPRAWRLALCVMLLVGAAVFTVVSRPPSGATAPQLGDAERALHGQVVARERLAQLDEAFASRRKTLERLEDKLSRLEDGSALRRGAAASALDASRTQLDAELAGVRRELQTLDDFVAPAALRVEWAAQRKVADSHMEAGRHAEAAREYAALDAVLDARLRGLASLATAMAARDEAVSAEQAWRASLQPIEGDNTRMEKAAAAAAAFEAGDQSRSVGDLSSAQGHYQEASRAYAALRMAAVAEARIAADALERERAAAAAAASAA
ncbi:MAG: protein kinase, partial [Gammaproteobacteria bacterium]|nr:protein kinase [Gammaproteobacteria bacterium]